MPSASDVLSKLRHFLWSSVQNFTVSLVHFKVSCTKYINPIALRKAKVVYNFGLSECSRVNERNIFLHGSQLLTFCCFCKHFDLTCFTLYCDYFVTVFVNSITFQETTFMAKYCPFLDIFGTCSLFWKS